MSEQNPLRGQQAPSAQPWLGTLEAEIGRELGQAVTLTAGGELPQPSRSFADRIEVPGARLLLISDSGDTAAFLAEARVVEAGQLDEGMLRELWSGILASVASRMGGKAIAATAPGPSGSPCVLGLGNAKLRLSLAVESTPAALHSSPAAPPAPVSAPGPGGRNFDLLFEVELDASVRFGSREMELKDLLELGPGDVVELDRQVADPVDLVVGDRIVARGEVVLVNGNFGLRVTEVAEPVRRLESIRCVW